MVRANATYRPPTVSSRKDPNVCQAEDALHFTSASKGKVSVTPLRVLISTYLNHLNKRSVAAQGTIVTIIIL